MKITNPYPDSASIVVQTKKYLRDVDSVTRGVIL